MHTPPAEQHLRCSSALRGHYGHFDLQPNSRSLNGLLQDARCIWSNCLGGGEPEGPACGLAFKLECRSTLDSVRKIAEMPRSGERRGLF